MEDKAYGGNNGTGAGGNGGAGGERVGPGSVGFPFTIVAPDHGPVNRRSPNKQILEFEGLTFRYNYETQELGVYHTDPKTTGGLLFSEKELVEFRQALLVLGLANSESGVTYR